jgi:N-acetylglucosaminyl-diphospho-decaprenol L-rhamnosyltransferase
VSTVDVVVVSFNSRDALRTCVEHLVGTADVNVIVVDNASTDDSLATVADLPITRIPIAENRGFAYGCNVGWREGNARHVLFLNPDAELEPEALGRLVDVLDEKANVGIVGPRIESPGGDLEYSQRRFPRLRSTYARALFLHRIAPQASWADELIRDQSAYNTASYPDWLSGACLMIRRELLQDLGGFDEAFFMYCEDIDLCRRARDAGFQIEYVADAVATHEGGASAPRPSLLPTLAESRLLYARKHCPKPIVALERLGLALEAATHSLLSRRGRDARRGHARALRRIAARNEVRDT